MTDAEAKKLMLDVWLQNTTKDLAQIDLIDIKPRVEVKNNWRDFIFCLFRLLSNNFLAFHLGNLFALSL